MTTARNITPVILAGGQGMRLDFFSKEGRSKPFLKVMSRYSPFQQTVLSVSAINKPVIVCGKAFRNVVIEQLKGINVQAECIILEPFQKGTTGALALAALYLKALDTQMLVMPTNHSIKDEDAFVQDVQYAAQSAESHLVLFGTRLARPETRFGYIFADTHVDHRVHPVWAFVERPNKSGAINLHTQGCMWNTGIMMCRPRVFLDIVAALEPEIYRNCERAFYAHKIDMNMIYPNPECYVNADAVSVGFSIMEKVKDAYVLEVSPSVFDWGLRDSGLKMKEKTVARLRSKSAHSSVMMT
jgi:mannose-1-phosphate guanylyltransferase / mannose-6-phosphate isomerase